MRGRSEDLDESAAPCGVSLGIRTKAFGGDGMNIGEHPPSVAKIENE